MDIDEKHELLSKFKKELKIDKIFCFIYFLISFISVVEDRIKNIIVLVSIEG